MAKGPLVLLANHRPAPSCQPIFAVRNAALVADQLKERGCALEGLVETPNGTAYGFSDPSKNTFAILENNRPLENSYKDESSPAAIR